MTHTLRAHWLLATILAVLLLTALAIGALALSDGGTYPLNPVQADHVEAIQ
jgi:hypothetical protein